MKKAWSPCSAESCGPAYVGRTFLGGSRGGVGVFGAVRFGGVVRCTDRRGCFGSKKAERPLKRAMYSASAPAISTGSGAA